MTTTFTLGQRWMSNSESNLGLGTVVAIDNRTVTLFFPAANETRLYAQNNVPLTRICYNPGDSVVTEEGWKLNVEQVLENNGLYIYHGTREDNGEPHVTVVENLLDGKLYFNKPQDLLFSGKIDRTAQFALRYQAIQYYSEQLRSPWRGLQGMRTNLIPHQLHIAYTVSHRYAPRVLLADEVGLGKTIEAGMIIHQKLLTGGAEKVLIVVPEALQYQWIVEMLRRFNLRFSLFDNSRYDEAILDSDNPFETEQLIICSLGFATSSQKRLQLLSDVQWDILVVDEAHHIIWNEERPGKEYSAIARLAENSQSVLLLTATPEQLGMQSHFARLQLLDPDRFYDYQTFIKEQEQYQAVAKIIDQLLSDEKLDNQALNTLTELLSEQGIEPQLNLVNSEQEWQAARKDIIQQLIDRHGTSRILFRNSRQSIKGFPQRKLLQIKLPVPSVYQSAIKVAMRFNRQQPLIQKAQEMLHPEQIFQNFEGENNQWLSIDPRVDWLIQYLKQQRQEKILIICAETETVLALEQYLREKEAFRVAVFHEKLTLLERDRAAAYFSDREEGAQILLCSEIGSEGRNFQFAHQLIMFDLPMNPDLLEQRIGRLDRIGQINDIQIIVPYMENSAQSVLLHWFHDGMNAFEQTCPVGRALYDQMHESLLPYLAYPDQLEDFEQLIKQTQEQYKLLSNQLQQGRDRILELNSNGGEQAQQLASAIAAQDNDSAFVNFALNLFDLIGINQEDHNNRIISLTPSEHMLIESFPGLPEEGCMATFERNIALAREDVQFITWDHPIIHQAIDLILSNDIGRCSVAALKNKALPAGMLFIELIYLTETQAPKSLQLDRFLPITPIRLLLDQKGNNLATKASFDVFNQQLSNISRQVASKLISMTREEIHKMMQPAEAIIDKYAHELIQQAQRQANETLTAELNRLQALKCINPSIRDEELSWVEQQLQEIENELSQTRWKLDAIRLVVVTHG